MILFLQPTKWILVLPQVVKYMALKKHQKPFRFSEVIFGRKSPWTSDITTDQYCAAASALSIFS